VSIIEETILSTLHVHSDEIPWIGDPTQFQVRILHARPEEDLLVEHFRSAPGMSSPPHKHNGRASLFTLTGTWGHRASVQDYRVGTYVYEPVGVLHRFHAGPTSVEAVAISSGNLDFYDEEGREILDSQSIAARVERYYHACEEAGLPRPSLLR
jgi:2,4'-dihydroxyacetophenone dioxygenase